MRVSWEADEARDAGMTRRRWVKIGLATAAFAAGAAATGGSAALLRTILPPPTFPRTRSLPDTLLYTAFPTDQWWNVKANTPVTVTDFGLWMGASAVWRALLDERGTPLPGTGYPVVVIRVPRVDTYYSLPSPLPWALPSEVALYYDDPTRDIRIVVGFDRCTHLCCYPGWHVVTNPPPTRDYLVSPPTYDVYAQDPIYCVCHGTQYDPLLLIRDINPNNNVAFPGMELVHGPGTFGMPLVPVRAVNDILEGRMVDSRWYLYC